MTKIACASRAIPLTVVVALGACTGAFGDSVHQQFHQVIPARGVPTVHVANLAGEIRVIAWAKPFVDVKATKSGPSLEAVHAIAIDIRSAGDGIYVATKYAGPAKQGGVRYAISVPANASVDIENSAGTVDVGGIRGNVTAKTQAGSIDADLGNVGSKRAIDLSAATGTVRLTIARASNASVEAHSTVGSFSSDFPAIMEIRQNIVGAGASGKIGSGSASIRLFTGTGSIDLKAG